MTREAGGAADERAPSVEAVYPLVYDELRRLARRQLAREQPGHTLDSIALVNEAYLKLAGGHAEWQNRAHFLAIAARAMRAILVDHARARATAKRGGPVHRVVHLDELAGALAASRDEHLIALDEALTRLATVNAEASRTVEYRYFGGLTLEETAEVLQLPVITVRRRWDFAKAWLQRELSEAV